MINAGTQLTAIEMDVYGTKMDGTKAKISKVGAVASSGSVAELVINTLNRLGPEEIEYMTDFSLHVWEVTYEEAVAFGERIKAENPDVKPDVDEL